MIESERLIDEIELLQKDIDDTYNFLNEGNLSEYYYFEALENIAHLENTISSLRKQLREVCRKREAEYENR